MEAEYRQEMCRRTMVLKRNTGEGDNFREKMILKNSLRGIARVNVRFLNGESYYSYDMGSCQTLKNVFDGNSMSVKELRAFLSGLSQVSHELEKYLLDIKDLLLSPEQIFWDLEKEEPCFCYYPGNPEGSSGIMELGQFLIDVVDKEDKEASGLAYSYFDRICEGMVLPDDILKNTETERGTEVNRGTEGRETRTDDHLSMFEANSDSLDESRLWKEGENDNYYLDNDILSGRGESKKGNPLILLLAFLPAVLAAASYGIIFMNPQYTALLGLSDRDYVRVGIGVTAFSGVFIALGMYLWNKRKKEEEDRKRDIDSLNSDIKEEEYRYDELEERSMEKLKEESADGCDATVLLSDLSGGRGGKSVPILFGRINGEDRTFRINRTPFMIGKMKNKADGVIADSKVSRIHACIREDDGRYYLSDLNSTNGTCINEKKLAHNETVALSDGDNVRFAGVTMTFRLA